MFLHPMYQAKYVRENGGDNVHYTREKQIRNPDRCDLKQLRNEMIANAKKNDKQQ
jgi:hypothetical protein